MWVGISITMIPNLFTLFRLFSSFVIILLYLLFPRNAFEFILPLYIVSAITDYYDGKLARKYGNITKFGKCFDIIADKALVLVILLIGLDMNAIHIIFVFIILFREFTVSGMREVLAVENISIPASKLGKWKTGFQMTACGFVVGQYANWALDLLEFTRILAFVSYYVEGITLILVIIASVLTLWSGGEYVKSVFYKKK